MIQIVSPFAHPTLQDRVQYSAVSLRNDEANAKVTPPPFLIMFLPFGFIKTVQNVSSSQGAIAVHIFKDDDPEILVTPVPHLLNSNVPPSEEERNKVNEILVIAHQHLAKLQNKLVGTPSGDTNRKDKDPGVGRGQLEKPISLAQSFIQMHESVNSCLRYFPVELLRLIFIQCLPNLDRYDWNHKPWNHGRTFTLSQICRRWRQIAHDTPQLWSVIGKIRLNPKSAKKGRNTTFYFINEFLQRSRNQGLWLDISAHFMEYTTPDAHPLIELVLQHADRWEVVTIASTWPTITSFLYNKNTQSPSSFDPQQFSRLRRLGIEIWKQYSEMTGILRFKGAPILEDLFVSGYPPPLLNLPLDGLKKYRDCAVSTRGIGSTLCDVFNRSPQIQRLEVIDLLRFDNAALPHSVCLDHLSVVHLTMRKGFSGNWVDVESIFDTLTLPCLTELKVAGFPGSELVAKLTSLFLRSHCVLSTLCLSTSDAFPRDLDRLLELTPQLEELDVDIPSMMDMFVLGVGNNPSRSGGAVVPHLKRLTLRFTSPNNGIEHCASLLSLIARLRFNHPLPSSIGDDSAVPVGTLPTACPQNDCRTCFRLVFADQDTAIAAQIYLYSCAKIQNVSPQLGNADAGCLTTFLSWHTRLREELPELYGMPAPGKRRLDFGFSHRLNRLLVEIEAFEPLDCLGLPSLLTSKLHHSLYGLTRIPSHIPGDSTFNYRDRSTSILLKWEGFLKNDMANLDWALMGCKSLVYIPDIHTLRRDRKVFDMIYGLEDHLRIEELDWINHL